jgi:hypothetical protein
MPDRDAVIGFLARTRGLEPLTFGSVDGLIPSLPIGLRPPAPARRQAPLDLVSGYLREKDAQAQLQALLTDARRGASEQRRTGVIFDVVADEWLAWGVRDRGWKPSTLPDSRSNINAQLNPAFEGRRVEKITAD